MISIPPSRMDPDIKLELECGFCGARKCETLDPCSTCRGGFCKICIFFCPSCRTDFCPNHHFFCIECINGGRADAYYCLRCDIDSAVIFDVDGHMIGCKMCPGSAMKARGGVKFSQLNKTVRELVLCDHGLEVEADAE